MTTARDPLDRTVALVRAACACMLAAGGAQALIVGIFSPELFADKPNWAPGWAAAYLVLVTCYALAERGADKGLTRARAALFLIQAIAAFYTIWVYPSFLITSMIVVIAWQVAWATSLRNALWAAAAMTAALLVQKCVDTGGAMSLVILISAVGFQLFAISTAHLAKREAQARDRLTRANAELTATQALLTESARMSERLQISRDLHDVLGHNLTTLAIHLDVASRLTKGRAATHLGLARDVAGALLNEVRDVVSRVRVQPVDLRRTLLALTDGLAGLTVRLSLPDDLAALDPARADTILRCVQELITNTLRHADARELVVELVQASNGQITISARDDGKGGAFVEGHGLAGMRERFEALGGSLSVFSRYGEGFRVLGAIPPAGAYP